MATICSLVIFQLSIFIICLMRYFKELNLGPIPIVLRAFYEGVGAVNFVGQPIVQLTLGQSQTNNYSINYLFNRLLSTYKVLLMLIWK